MEIIKTLLWIVQIISAVSVVILVLLQHGKGADAGATFGSGGGSGSLFGATGSSNFLSRATAIGAFIFFITTLSLVIMVSKSSSSVGVMAGMNNKPVASPVVAAPALVVASAPVSATKVETSAPAKVNQIPQ